jgi:hypothetical protein
MSIAMSVQAATRTALAACVLAVGTSAIGAGGGVLPAEAATFQFSWTGQIAGFSLDGSFSFDETRQYEGGIVRKGDLQSFVVSFFDPQRRLLRTYSNNHLSYPNFNFNFDTTTGRILQDGAYFGPEGIDIGEKTPLPGGGFAGLNFWSRPALNAQGQVPPPHVHIDDWANEFGFPVGFSTHEDVAFFTRTTGELLATGRVGEAYRDTLGDRLGNLGEPATAAVPEPTTAIGLGIAGVAGWFTKKRSKT